MNLQKKKDFIIKFVYLVIWIIIFCFFLKIISEYFFPFLIGAAIAHIVQKPATFLSNKTSLKKQTCAAILSVVFFISIIFLIIFFGWSFYNQFTGLIVYFADYAKNISYFFEKIYVFFNVFLKEVNGELHNAVMRITSDTLNELMTRTSVLLSNVAASLIKNLPRLLISVGVTVVATCYISKDYYQLIKFIKGLINDDFYRQITDIKNIFVECFLRLIVGYFWLFLITFFELVIGFFVLKINHTIILAFLISVLDLLPVIGTGTILLPWAIFNFLQGEYNTGFGLVILYLAIVIIRNFIEPKIIGKQIGINPIFTLIFIFLGLRFGGIIGMIIFPIMFTVFFTYYRRKLSESD